MDSNTALLVGSFPIQPQLNEALVDLVDLAKELKGHQQSHKATKFCPVGILLLRNAWNHIGTFDIAEPVGGAAPSSVGDDEG